MLTGNLHLEWEIPSRSTGNDIREWISKGAVLTLKDGVVHMGHPEQEAVKFYGSTGSRVLKGVIQALESPVGVYRTHTSIPFPPMNKVHVLISMYIDDRDLEITSSRDRLQCSYYYTTADPEFLSTLRQTLAWICLISRDDGENNKGQIILLSTGSWEVTDTFSSFHLHAVEVADWHGSGWTKGIKHAVVVCLDPMIPKTPLLRTVFPMACQLAAVRTPMHVERGLIFHGVFTALIPLELCQHGNILWEVEMKDDDFLLLSEIQCLQTNSWFQTLDLGLLSSAPTLIR